MSKLEWAEFWLGLAAICGVLIFGFLLGFFLGAML